MTTILDKKLTEALTKARNLGLVEEAFTIDGTEIVLRNLRPEEYTDVLRECDGLDNTAEYFVRYQKAHVSRAIIEVNGTDLRAVKYVAVEETDTHGKVKKLKRELHQYLSDNLVSTWSKEVLTTAMRKFYDVCEVAERRAKDGITFHLPDETSEDKYRRLMQEAAAVERDVPPSMVGQILDELGLMHKSTAEEVKRAMEAADAVARESEPTDEPEPTTGDAIPDEPDSEPAEREPEALRDTVPSRPPRVQPPRIVDPHVTLQQAIAQRKASGADEVKTRAEEIAALEGLSDDADGLVPQPYTAEVAVVRRREPVDMTAAAAILDQQPVSGINPRFRPPTKL